MATEKGEVIGDPFATSLAAAAERTEAVAVLLWTELARDLPGWHSFTNDDLRQGQRPFPDVQADH